MSSSDLLTRIDAELALGREAAGSNPGKTRVCARRAAGWAIQVWYQAREGPGWSGDAMKQINRLRADPAVPEAPRAAAERLSTKVDREHRLPFKEEALDDAKLIVEWALGVEMKDIGRKTNMSELDDFRAEKDEFFRHDRQSPLTREQKTAFTGLSYFPEAPELRLVVAVQPAETKETIQMQTSTGEAQPYQRYGRFKFTVEGQEAELTIYSGDYGYFLPFADSLAGSETYGAGRYLEPEPAGEGKFEVDFNLAYNPYCAYNRNFSCPIPPRENRMLVAIRAGEKVFHTEGAEH